MSDEDDPRGTDWLLTRITPELPKEGTMNEDDEQYGPSGAAFWLVIILLGLGGLAVGFIIGGAF